jgi:hypothetical protein
MFWLNEIAMKPVPPPSDAHARPSRGRRLGLPKPAFRRLAMQIG